MGVYYVILLGFLGSAIFFLLMSLFGPFADPWLLRLLLFGIGLTLGHSVIAMQYTTFTKISSVNMGKATTLFNVQNRLGAAIGISVNASLLVFLQNRTMSSLTNPAPYQISIFGAAIFLLIALVLTVFSRNVIQETEQAQRKAS
ncbi:MFS transporter [Cytobacillus horneckiae]|nr:hypothetical protein [Cytobacillus horneckiae]